MNGVDKSVVQTLNKLGLCVNYDVSMQTVKELSDTSKLPGQFNGISPTPPLARTIVNGGPESLSAGQISSGAQVIGETSSVRKYYDKGPGQDNAPTNASPQDIGVFADQQIGVQGTITKLPDLNFGLEIPYYGKVTPPARVSIERNDESLSRTGPVGTGSDKISMIEKHGAPVFKSAVVIDSASKTGYEVSATSRGKNPSSSLSREGITNMYPQTSASTATTPLPPLPPALTNPALPHNASPQEILQYAMIMHNHSKLNKGSG